MMIETLSVPRVTYLECSINQMGTSSRDMCDKKQVGKKFNCFWMGLNVWFQAVVEVNLSFNEREAGMGCFFQMIKTLALQSRPSSDKH